MNDDSQFIEYQYRFVILAIFTLVSMLNGMSWVIVSSISVQIAKAYGVSENIVSIIPMSYMFIYIIVNIPSNWVLDTLGIRKGILSGAILTALGSVIRCFVNFSFPFAIIGQIVCAIGQPFILNAPSKIAVRWFKTKNRSLALAALAVVNIIGTAIGFVIPSAFVDDISVGDETIQHEFLQLNLFYGGLGVVAAILTIIFFKQSPPTMPSLSAQAEIAPFFQTLKILYTSPKFLGLTAAFSTVLGTFNVFGSIMQEILQPYGYTSNDVSLFAALMLVSGVISAAIFGMYTEKTLKYHNTFIICGIMGLRFFEDTYWAFILIFISLGIVLIPIIPLSIDYGCQIMFPVGQAQITGTLMTSGQIFGIIFILVPQNVFGLQSQNKDAAFLTVLLDCCFMIVGCVAYCFFNSELKRSKLESHKLDSLASSEQI